MRALLFDLDGTLIDSMPHHRNAWVHWYARRGLPMPGDVASFAATAGRTNAEILAELFPEETVAAITGMADEKEALYRGLAAESLVLVAGAEGFLREARAAGLRLAVCTATTPLNMALAFSRFGIDGWVDTVTSPADAMSPGAMLAEPGISSAGAGASASASAGAASAGPAGAGDSSGPAGAPVRGKPHPDIFLEAAHRLGVAPADCIVFEDAPLGVEAARRAGMPAVVLTTTLPAAAFSGFPNVIAAAADFTEIDLATLLARHGELPAPGANPSAEPHSESTP